MKILFIMAVSVFSAELAMSKSEKELKGFSKSNVWSMFRGQPDLRGVAEGELSNALKLAWTFQSGDAIKSSPVVAQDTVYVGSNDGKVYALDLRTGKEVWSFKTAGVVESTPLILDNIVYFGSGDFYLYALDASTGKKIWAYKTNDKILGSTNWSLGVDGKEKRILFGCYDTFLYCVKAESGEKVWAYETESYINGTPAVNNGQVIFGGCDGSLRVINSLTGKKQSEISLEAYIAGSAAILDEHAYLGHYGNEFVCVNIGDGTTVWTYSFKNFPFFSSPAVGESTVVFGGRDKSVHCVNRKNGAEVWRIRTGGAVDSSPVICDGKVVVGSENGRLYMLDLKSGKILWQYDIGQGVTSSPAVVDGSVYIGANDGALYAFGPQ